MDNKLKELNNIVKDYGYEVKLGFTGRYFNVITTEDKEYLSIIYDKDKSMFSIKTFGSNWGYEQMLEFKKEFMETFHLVEKMNEVMAKK